MPLEYAIDRVTPKKGPIVKLSLDVVEVDVNDEGEYELFGNPHYICPDHLDTDDIIKTCFLDNVITRLQYAFDKDEDLSPGARKLKRQVLDTIKIVRR